MFLCVRGLLLVFVLFVDSDLSGASLVCLLCFPVYLLLVFVVILCVSCAYYYVMIVLRLSSLCVRVFCCFPCVCMCVCVLWFAYCAFL